MVDYGRRCDDLAQGLTSEEPEAPHQGARRLSRRLLALAHQACDQGELDVARMLLEATETVFTRRREYEGAVGRRLGEQIVLAYERWWKLSNPPEEKTQKEVAWSFASVRKMLLSGPDTDMC
ncbi:hypothetical protein AA0472_0986 [Acetobacter estunensis NRIC 0472]|uniref:Uncharacterized protein n=1 Tax=Acetobacter estunensis TaxID=104097 RepID=A0A967B6F6_9PROT|nr:hypothetical protein [Acetobacter estunensis]NHO54695.1 hypothetical protein [Acetobacter estunensis]GBQ23095.1 hypothetical protein AA0472_0986 [Acetobacter estunensis NRIC 0472]